MRKRYLLLIALSLSLFLVPMSAAADTGATSLRVSEGRFVDADGATVLLRGVNVAGNSKTPPFVPFSDASVLDPLPQRGINTIRLLFNWEAYEPQPGQYDREYLSDMVDIARAAADLGLYVIVDIHQDGFSRNLAGGCGDGFPLWAVTAGATTDQPDNGPGCADWAAKMALDPDVHASFRDFYAGTAGVRDAYLTMVGHVADRFGAVDRVIGYDPLNEPWGTDAELTALYSDATAAIRDVHPEAIMFLEGHVTTNGGDRSRLPKPDFGNVAYAPHFYDRLALASNAWSGDPAPTRRAFTNMTATAEAWGAPLFVGEFGIGATAANGTAYMDLQYTHLDTEFASGAQWNYTPAWNPTDRDGWNGEDFSIVDDFGGWRATATSHPYPARTAGTPTELTVTRDRIDYAWQADSGLGDTEFHLAAAEWFGTDSVTVTTSDGTECERDSFMVRCRTDSDAPADLTIMPT